MAQIIYSQLGNIITVLLVVIAFALAVANIVSTKKKGKNSCGFGCSCCDGSCKNNKKDFE